MKGTLMLLLVLIGNRVIAQNWQEWMQQKKTQRKYLLQQIAGLKLYLDYAEKGYKIAQTGLTTIEKIKHADLALHDEFFKSLKKVNPKIASSMKVTSALEKTVLIVKEVRQAISGLQSSGQFTPEEVAMYVRGFEGLLMQCTETVEELVNLITSGYYEMTDEQRLQRIEAIAKVMDAHYAFCTEQSAGLGNLALQREVEGVDIKYLKN